MIDEQTIMDLRAQVTALTQQLRLCNIDQFNAEAKVTALTQQRDAHANYLDEIKTKLECHRAFIPETIEQLQQYLAAMTKERDELAKDCDDLRALAERLLAKLSEGKVMVDDIKIMGEL